MLDILEEYISDFLNWPEAYEDDKVAARRLFEKEEARYKADLTPDELAIYEQMVAHVGEPVFH